PTTRSTRNRPPNDSGVPDDSTAGAGYLAGGRPSTDPIAGRFVAGVAPGRRSCRRRAQRRRGELRSRGRLRVAAGGGVSAGGASRFGQKPMVARSVAVITGP